MKLKSKIFIIFSLGTSEEHVSLVPKLKTYAINGITLKLDKHSSLHLTNISAPPFGLTLVSKEI